MTEDLTTISKDDVAKFLNINAELETHLAEFDEAVAAAKKKLADALSAPLDALWAAMEARDT